MNKTSNQYYVAYEKDERGGYVASVPAISGCVVRGKTLQEAHRNIRSAIKECLEVMHDFKKKYPRETINPESIRRFSFVRIP